MSETKSKCVIEFVDMQTKIGRDPFARQGIPGNRWIKFGCDSEIPDKYKNKVVQAVKLAYALNDKKSFTKTFDTLILGLVKGKIISYLDALDAITLNFADTSLNPIVKAEMKNALESKKLDPQYKIEGGFTIGKTGQVFIREFVLNDWNEKQIASFISHEALHVAGAPGDMMTELVLATLYQHGYLPHP